MTYCLVKENKKFLEKIFEEKDLNLFIEEVYKLSKDNKKEYISNFNKIYIKYIQNIYKK